MSRRNGATFARKNTSATAGTSNFASSLATTGISSCRERDATSSSSSIRDDRTNKLFQTGVINVDGLPSNEQQNRWHERLELRGETLTMSRQNSIQNTASRTASSASSSSLTSPSPNNLPRVHAPITMNCPIGHDHTRPLPPPRLSETTLVTTTLSSLTATNLAPLTAPLAPLSANGSFRSNSRNSTIVGTSTTTTTTSNNNINNGNNNNNATTTHHVQPSVADSGVVSSTTILPLRPAESPRSPLGEVTLTVPRPDVDRAVNEYVETPFRQANPASNCPSVNHAGSNQKCLKNERRLLHHHHHHQQQQQQSLRRNQQHASQRSSAQAKSPTASTTSAIDNVSAQAPRIVDNNATRRQRSDLLQSSLSSVAASTGVTITKQPVSFTKEPSSPIGSVVVGRSLADSTLTGRFNDTGLSIMCDYCGRCRCESCREPTPLPSRWLCDNACFCSAETALDYASCLCCVKGLFYHCADSASGTDAEGGANCADEPCSCTGPRRTARWACLGALTLVLPCLMCYWPLKGCVALCETCYARHASQGCRCDPIAHAARHHTAGSGGGGGGGGGGSGQNVVLRDSRDPEKRLLDPVTPEL